MLWFYFGVHMRAHFSGITREADGAPQLDGLGLVRALEAKSVLSHESFTPRDLSN